MAGFVPAIALAPREGFQVQVNGRLVALIGGDRFAHALYIAGERW
jgi:hypothetical protein